MIQKSQTDGQKLGRFTEDFSYSDLVRYEVNSAKNDEFEMVVDFVKSDIFDKEIIRFERQ